MRAWRRGPRRPVVNISSLWAEERGSSPPYGQAEVACTVVPEVRMQHAATAQTLLGGAEELASAGFEA